MSTIANDGFHTWEWKKDTKRTLASTIVIVAGVAVLVKMNRWDTSFLRDTLQKQTISSEQMIQIQAALETTAGAASIMDSEFMLASFETTAGQQPYWTVK